MTSTVSILVICDGRSLEGCPYVSVERVDTDSRTEARKILAADQGWQYRRIMQGRNLIGWADVCPKCVRRRG